MADATLLQPGDVDALLVIYGPEVPSAQGFVAVFSASEPLHTVVHFGEVVFSVDR